jgi:hypothetical protein
MGRSYGVESTKEEETPCIAMSSPQSRPTKKVNPC